MDEDTTKWLTDRSGAFVEISDSLFDSVLADLDKYVAVLTRPTANELTESFAKEHGIEERLVGSVLAWVTAIARVVLEKGSEQARLEAKSAFDMKFGDKVFSSRLDRLIRAAEISLPAMRAATQKSISAKGLLPIVEELDGTVELRAVLGGSSKAFGHLDRKGSPVVGLVPIASFRLLLDSGFPGEVVFQAGRGEVISMSNALMEMLRRMDEIEAFALEREK